MNVHDGIPARRRWSPADVVPARAADTKLVVEAGRIALVWAPCYTIMGPRFSAGMGIAAASLLAAVWLTCLRSGFVAVPFALGIPIRCAVGAATGFVGASAVALWVPGLGMSLWTILALAVSVFTLTTIWESVAERISAKRRVLVVGASSYAADIAAAAEYEGHTPFAVVGTVDDEPDDTSRLGSIAELTRVIEEQRPDLVVLTDAETSAIALDRMLAAPADGYKVVGLAHFFEHAFGRVPLQNLSPSWFMSVLHLRRPTYTRFAKRTFDVICAAVMLALTAPLWPVIGALVRLTPGRIIYRQTRVGEGGRHFTMFKFRTMRADAEADHASFTDRKDPRVTRVGRVLRMTHLDELPQLWNVFKGDMSVVGPRPERPEFIPMLEEAVPFFSRRLLVKPGVTGWAQLRSDYAADADGAADKLSYDLWYLRHRNLLVDLAICAKTFSGVLVRPGR